jgi:hypothetical protein
LRALAPDLVAPFYWSIVDAAILRLEARLGTITNLPALREIATRFDATAAGARDPESAERARKLAARARARGAPPGP